MLRITADEHEDFVLLRAEGSLRGPWVPELERVWRASGAQGKPVRLDLAEVLYVDDAAKALLARMYQDGVALCSVSGPFMTLIVEEIAAGAACPVGFSEERRGPRDPQSAPLVEPCESTGRQVR